MFNSDWWLTFQTPIHSLSGSQLGLPCVHTYLTVPGYQQGQFWLLTHIFSQIFFGVSYFKWHFNHTELFAMAGQSLLNFRHWRITASLLRSISIRTEKFTLVANDILWNLKCVIKSDALLRIVHSDFAQCLVPARGEPFWHVSIYSWRSVEWHGSRIYHFSKPRFPIYNTLTSLAVKNDHA